VWRDEERRKEGVHSVAWGAEMTKETKRLRGEGQRILRLARFGKVAGKGGEKVVEPLSAEFEESVFGLLNRNRVGKKKTLVSQGQGAVARGPGARKKILAGREIVLVGGGQMNFKYGGGQREGEKSRVVSIWLMSKKKPKRWLFQQLY